LSPDGKWAAAIVATPPQLIVYATGAGEPIRIDVAPIDRLMSAEWFPDGTQVLVCGAEASAAPRCQRQDLRGGAPVRVTPEGVLASIAPDGQTLLLALQNGSRQVSSISGGQSRPIEALRPGDRQIAWRRDSQAVYVQEGSDAPARVERVDLMTGARTLVRQLAPDGVGQVATLYVVDWIDDGRWYAYNYTSLPSTLFVVTGAID
jgi:hypothetical protein